MAELAPTHPYSHLNCPRALPLPAVFSPGADPSLLLFYDFNEGGGVKVHDGSGAQRDIDLSDERHVNATEVAWVSNGVCGHALEFFTEDNGACVQSPVNPR